MSSTGVNIGVPTETRSSSRVLKPPGGGHTNIFGPPEDKPLKPRAKNNQQNSSSMCEIMGRAEKEAQKAGFLASEPEAPEPPRSVEAVITPELIKPAEPAKTAKATEFAMQAEPPKPVTEAGRVRVPPGGFSSGLW